LAQLKYYDELGHNIYFSENEISKINLLIESDLFENVELAKQIILERLNNN